MGMKDLAAKQKLHVHQERRQMMHKAAVVFFPSYMEESLTIPVPLLIMTGLGAHLMVLTVERGLTV